MTLYPATLLNSLISSSSSLILSSGLSMYSIMSSANSRALLLFWSGFLYFFLFSPFSLNGVARSSRTMLNNSAESGHPCLVPDLRANVFSFSLLRKMLAVGLSHMAFIMLRFSSVQSLSHVWLFATPWTTAHQASLSITNSQSLPKPMSIE